MKKSLLVIGLLLLIFYVFLLSLTYSEIKTERIQKLDKNLFEDLKKRGFLPNCFPKNIKNIITTWDIDTNEFYMKYDIEENEFYSFDQCRLVGKSEIQMPRKQSWIKQISFPNFVLDLNDQIETNKNLILYVSYKEYKLVEDEPFYILIDNNRKIGFAFSH